MLDTVGDAMLDAPGLDNGGEDLFGLGAPGLLRAGLGVFPKLASSKGLHLKSFL